VHILLSPHVTVSATVWLEKVKVNADDYINDLSLKVVEHYQDLLGD